MKKSIAYLLAAASLLAACNKNHIPSENTPAEGEPGLVTVNLAPRGVETKVHASLPSGIAFENRIYSVQIFIFDAATGLRETDKYLDGQDAVQTTSITLNSKTGSKKIWALVNAPRLSALSEADLLQNKVSYLGEGNIPTENGGLTMSGSVTAEITPYSAGDASSITQANIPVSRLASRIDLNSITVDFRGTQLEGCSFTVEDIYLKNVPSAVRFDGADPGLSSNADYWSNRIKYSGGGWMTDGGGNGISSLTKWSRTALPSNGTAGESTAVNEYFYSYPNPATVDDTTSTWTGPRRTKLVIKAKIKGTAASEFVPSSYEKTTWYSFPIADSTALNPGETSDYNNTVCANHTYTISSIVITMPGKDNDDSDQMPQSGKLTVTVNVSEWGTATSLTYEL